MACAKHADLATNRMIGSQHCATLVENGDRMALQRAFCKTRALRARDGLEHACLPGNLGHQYM